MCHRLLITLIALMFSATGISAQEPEKEAFPIIYHEEKPLFNGGSSSLMTKWVRERQVYPRKALKAGLQGRVTIQFTITEKGKLKNAKVNRHQEPCSSTFFLPVIWQLPEDKDQSNK